jgi:hypothetical protein
MDKKHKNLGMLKWHGLPFWLRPRRLKPGLRTSGP